MRVPNGAPQRAGIYSFDTTVLQTREGSQTLRCKLTFSLKSTTFTELGREPDDEAMRPGKELVVIPELQKRGKISWFLIMDDGRRWSLNNPE
jgi:hypothetical protein